MSVDTVKFSSASFQEGITKFADLSPIEFRKHYLNLNTSLLNTLNATSRSIQLSDSPPPSFDWRKKGVVTPIKDQGYCGSCWAFTTTGNIEGLYKLKYGQLLRFSEQQLVDCDHEDAGCDGGLMGTAFQWIKDNGGLMLEDDYKYQGIEGLCKQDKSKNKVKVEGYELLDTTNEQYIKEYLIKLGPLAAALNADQLKFYIKGIIDESEMSCDPRSLNHGVLIVGYGIEGKKEFWIVKNSWGEDWGERGYFRIALGKGVCGINTYVLSAILK